MSALPAETRALIARERDLPALGLLLDPGALAARGMRVRYLRLKPGTSVVAGLETPVGPAFALATSPRAAVKLEKAAVRAPEGSVLHHDRALRLLIARPRADRRLPGLRSLARRASHSPAALTLAYKPQRRWVGRRQGAEGAAVGPVLRLYRRGDLAGLGARWPRAEADGPLPLRVPRILAEHPRRGLLATEVLLGTRLDLLEDGSARCEALREAGRGIARWHRLPVPARAASPLPDPRDLAAQITALLPEEGERAAEIAARLAAALPADGRGGGQGGSSAQGAGAAVWCHGDFSADQLLVGPDGLALLDWDRSGAGPRSRDLATADAAGLSASAWEALLTGYDEISPVPADLGTARAHARLARAAEPLRTGDPAWPRALRAALAETEALLEDPAGPSAARPAAAPSVSAPTPATATTATTTTTTEEHTR
ncbi:aminoglycoside phosphotransferase family protein [Brachybacterium subflavum]|uniref:phosphotransferase n=1 Tax=Brachybacterium subflavum TaxID=2585206 RepID=UPI0012662381|nr:phosphotransferase [Brachybacterium subflavum]